MKSTVTLTELEEAINHWRRRSPSQGEAHRLCPQAAALAEPYAGMIMAHRHEIALSELGPQAREALQAAGMD
ncbi:DUF3717 domain-containing protein [Orrella sp. JC864]|uniref:DUF3717 domain-containing protein n=1 Tax=Orrella sp. JC864 TaxID=3120298 RepID=UPI00300A5688